MEFRILGPVEAEGSAGRLRLGTKQTALLSVLLLQANRVVPVDTLVDAVWADDPPARASATLQTAVFRLRQALAAAEPGAEQRLAFVPGSSGYRLDTEPAELDLDVFRARVAGARTAAGSGRLSEAADQLRAALALWRGAPLVALPGRHLAAQADRLAEERLVALEERLSVDLALHRAAELVPELRELVADHPLRERLRGQLMLALHLAGRQADALRVFDDTRRTLADELGVDPGPELCQLHQRILRGDRDLPAPAGAARQAGRNDLPGDIADFTGRDTEVRRLVAVLADNGRDGATAVVIAAVDGMAGIGKTTLAVHAAHQLADRYPDAQLFIDLHGHTTDQNVVEPMAALDVLLRALGVPGDRIPTALDDRSALWRAELAERRALLVLDNAATAAQVRPLLPGTPQCLALITSRRRLADLEIARTLSLDVLPAVDAETMFTAIVGAGRIAPESALVPEVMRLCGQLPLAIRVAAARLRSRPMWTVQHLVERLAQGHSGLSELTAGDRSVAAAFALSYRHLTAAQQRLFRLLGLHPGPDFDVRAAAALADLPVGEAERLLEDLVDVHLLRQPAPERYQFHDLLRQHARQTAQRADSPAARTRAVTRLLDYYVRASWAGDRLLYPHRPPLELEPSAEGAVACPLPDEDAALSWFAAEHPCLLAAQRLAVDERRHVEVWRLARTLDSFHLRRGHVHCHLDTWRAGLAAADRLDEPTMQTPALRLLALACSQLGRHDESLGYLRRCLAITERTGDVLGQGHTHRFLAMALAQRGDDHSALDHARHALRLLSGLDSPVPLADALSAVGWYQARVGDYAEAAASCERALDLHRRHRHREGEAATLDSLGYIAHHTRRHTDAVDHYRHALALRRDLGYRYGEATTLDHLGAAHAALGEHTEAREAWRQALDLYLDQHRGAEADAVRRQLSTVDQLG
ncbi:tetratricopeptide repeat protein [Solihabitans fulvus]|uniref:Tetratricopeptide repeat protein n=1 Tax=Solihabitans fulvus TaxID=1892852 RepID=A0A5B2XGF8_9PSEU|nr:BTAD domain-containing putative transcriptional regulator [Solihabitans fulvus]KAA2261960.1 tetratricopeptide repeat protein [Solihabitans fulvus]